MRLPFPVLVALFAVDAAAFAAFADSATSGSALVLGIAGALALGSTAALCERTWGIGLVLAGASAAGVAAAFHLASASYYFVAAIGAVPFLTTMKPMARFHRGATVLFALLAGAAGAASTVPALLARL